MRGPVVGRFDDRTTVGVEGAVLLLLERRTRLQVAAVRLALIGRRPEGPTGIQPLGPVRRVLGAGPLDAASAPKLVVREAAVVTRPSATALAPGVEGLLRRGPRDEGCAVLVLQVHPTGEVDEDLEIGARLAGRLDRLLREVHGAVHVGEG